MHEKPQNLTDHRPAEEDGVSVSQCHQDRKLPFRLRGDVRHDDEFRAALLCADVTAPFRSELSSRSHPIPEDPGEFDRQNGSIGAKCWDMLQAS